MFEDKLAIKIPISLPKKFDMKVLAIEEAQDLSNTKVDELIGYLKTFEMEINDRTEKKKKKECAFVSNTEEDEDQGESLSDSIALVGIKFNKALRRMEKKWR